MRNRISNLICTTLSAWIPSSCLLIPKQKAPVPYLLLPHFSLSQYEVLHSYHCSGEKPWYPLWFLFFSFPRAICLIPQQIWSALFLKYIQNLSTSLSPTTAILIQATFLSHFVTVSHPWHHWHWGPVILLGTGYPVHCRMLSSVPSLSTH